MSSVSVRKGGTVTTTVYRGGKAVSTSSETTQEFQARKRRAGSTTAAALEHEAAVALEHEAAVALEHEAAPAPPAQTTTTAYALEDAGRSQSRLETPFEAATRGKTPVPFVPTPSIARAGRIPGAAESFNKASANAYNEGTSPSPPPTPEQLGIYSAPPKPTVTKAERVPRLPDRLSQRATDAERGEGDWEPAAYNAAAFGAGVVAGTFGPIKELVTKPRQFAEDTARTVFDPAGTAKNVAANFALNPYYTTGEIAGATRGTPFVIGKAASYGKIAAKSLLLKEVPLSTITSEETAAGGYAISASTAETIKAFERTATIKPSGERVIYGSTAAPRMLEGDTAQSFGRSVRGVEDPGVYVSPADLTMVRFTRAGQTVTSYPISLSLNPASLVKSTPAIVIFEAKGITTLPASVTKTPGFKAVGEYHENVLAGSGEFAITKRSQIGQGDLPRQVNPASGKLEAGTTETEAVVPKGQTWKLERSGLGKVLGYNEYVKVAGEQVNLYRASLVADRPLVSGSTVPAASGVINSQRLVSLSRAYVSESPAVVSPATVRLGPSISPSTVRSSSGSGSFRSGVPAGSIYDFRPQGSSSSAVSLSPSRTPISPSYVSVGGSSSSGGKSRKGGVSGGSGGSGPGGGGSPPVITVFPSPSPGLIPGPVSPAPNAGGGPRAPTYPVTPKETGGAPPLVKRDAFYRRPTSPQEVGSVGFSVLSRVRGRFLSVGRSSTLEGASRKARRYVENTPAASFKVVKEGSSVGLELPNPGRGVRAKKKKGAGVTYVEPSLYRINTAGEFGGITLKSKGSKRRR